MSSTYDFAEPGFILVDKVNEMNNNWWTENIRATNPCGEQPLPPYGSCLAGVGQSHQVRGRSVHGQRTIRLGNVSQSREGVHAHARQRRRDQRLAAGAAARRNPPQTPPRHGFPGPGLDHHPAVHEIRLEEIGGVFSERVAGNGRGRLGSRSRSRAREGPGADHERRVHGHARDAAQTARDGQGWLARRRAYFGPGAARALQPLHAAHRRGFARIGGRARRGRRALYPPHVDRSDGHHFAVARQQRIERHRTLVRPSLLPQCDPRRQEVEGEDRRVLVRVAGVPRTGEFPRHAGFAESSGKAARLFHLRGRHRPQGTRRYPGGGAAMGGFVDIQDGECPDRLQVRRFQGHLHVRLRTRPQGLYDVSLQSGGIPGSLGQGRRPQEHDLRVHAGRRHGSRSERAIRRSNTTGKCTPPPISSMR